MGVTFNPFTGTLDFTGGGGGGGTIGGTIDVNQVAFGTALDIIGGSSSFTWDGDVLTLQPTVTDVVNSGLVFLPTVHLTVDSGATISPGFNGYSTVTGAVNLSSPTAGAVATTQALDYYNSGTVNGLSTNQSFLYVEDGTVNGTNAYGGAQAQWAGAFQYGGTTTRLIGVLANTHIYGGTAAIQAAFWAEPTAAPDGTLTGGNMAYYAGDYAGSATNPYYFWADSRGVFRIREDNTFNSVGQAITALYNPQFTKYTAGATNFERIVQQWESNVATITTEAGGTGTLRAFNLGDTGVQVQVNGKNLTLAGNLTTSGAFASTFTMMGATSVTFPTSGTLSTTTGTITSIATSTPITGGTITSTGTIGISDAAADGTTKGAATFTAADFNATTGVISLDYTNGQKASGSQPGFLSSADWTTFNNKGSGSVTSIATTSPISGGTITTTGTISLLVNVDYLFTHSQTITPGAAGQGGLTITGAIETASNPALNLTQTWNNSGVTFTGILLNVTNTASSSSSKLLDLQVGGSPICSITRTGGITLSGGGNVNISAGLNLTSSSASVAWRNGSTTLFSDANNQLDQRSSTNAQILNVYNTFASSTSFERLMFDWATTANVAMIYTQKGSGGGTARVLQLNYGGTTTSAISIPITSGEIVLGGNISTLGGATFHHTTTALTDGAGVGIGTLGTAPAAGNPTKWIGINDNGTTRYVPAW